MLTTTSPTGRLFHLPADAGRMYWGPGDRYRFLVTGEESGGAYFAMEALVPPGGGPPLHIHHREDETFYVLDGQITLRLGDKTISAGPGDFVNAPRGIPHCFRNDGDDPARLIVSFSPAGLERFFEETLHRALDPTQEPPEPVDVVAARYLAAAPCYGLEFA
jgi:quercetin dioxygenase-like cupin family protein